MNAGRELVAHRQTLAGAQRACRRTALASLFVYCLLIASMFSGPPAHAQLSTGDILGDVTDASGAGLANAELILTNTQTQERHTVHSDPSGQYIFTLLQPGHYSLQVDSTGFSTYRVNDISLAAGERRRLIVSMSVSNVSQSVIVSGAPPALDTDSTTMSTNVAQMQVQDLPLNGRNFVMVADLAAGANEGSPAALASGTRPDDRRQSSAIVANAQTDAQNNEMVEGIDNNEGTIGSIGVRPSVDAIAEFRVQTSLYPAEVGKTPGAVVNLITRGGTNDFHGSVYEFLRNDAVDARSFYATAGTVGRKPEYRQNQFGGSIGGPIRRDKAFFFGDYEGFRFVKGTTTNNTVPTVYEVAHPGDFTDVGGPNVTANVVTPGLNFFKMYPAPNSGNNTFVSSPNVTYYSTTVDARGDYRFNDNNLMFARYAYNNITVNTPSSLPGVNFSGVGLIEPGGSVSYPGTAHDVADQAILNYVHILSPRVSLELKAGYTYIDNTSYPLNQGTNAGNALGITNSNFNDFTSALPNFSVSGYAPLGDSTYLPLFDKDNIFQYSGSLTQVLGAHTFKYGAVLIRRQMYNEQPSSGEGAFSFSTSPNTTGSTTPSSVIPLINLLLGLPYTTSRSMQFSPRYPRTWEPSFYAQDDWRVTSKLTLNLGIRYDIMTADKFLGNNISQFDPVTAKILVAGTNSSDTTNINTDYRSFAPRLGFAANIRTGTVVRGGFGLVFFRDNTGPSVPFANAPFVTTYSPANLSVTNLTSLPLPVPSSTTNLSGALRGMDFNYRNSFIEQASFNVEQEFHSFVMTLAYVGEWGHKLRTTPDRNLALPSPITSPSYTTRRPFYNQYPLVTSINHIESNGFSNFNSLQATLQRNLGGGFYLNANYTWEKAMGDVQGYSAGGLYTSAEPSQMATLEYGLSELDIQQRFALMLNYKLPFGQKLTGVKAVLAKGWQFNAIDEWQTGMPFTVSNSVAQSNTGVSSDRPDQIANPILAHPTNSQWFNTAAFRWQKTGTIGSERRNMLFGPHYRHFDPSVFKTFALTEHTNLEFRVEAYNLSNTPNFGQPGATFPSTTFGVINSVSTNSTPRELQGSLRLSF